MLSHRPARPRRRRRPPKAGLDRTRCVRGWKDSSPGSTVGRAATPRLRGHDLPAAIAAFGEAWRHFDHAITVHSLGLLAMVQPLYESLAKLVIREGAMTDNLLQNHSCICQQLVGLAFSYGRKARRLPPAPK